MPPTKEEIQHSLCASSLAYEENQESAWPDDIKNFLAKEGNRVFHEFHEVNGFQFYSSSPESDPTLLYISFPGTQLLRADLRDVRADLQTSTKDGLHEGFSNRADEYIEQVLEVIKNWDPKKVVFCGHSLGGAVASIMALRILRFRQGKNDYTISKYEKRNGKITKKIEIQCITFGCPLFADHETSEKFSYARPSMTHIVRQDDPIPKLLTNNASWINFGIMDVLKFGFHKNQYGAMGNYGRIPSGMMKGWKLQWYPENQRKQIHDMLKEKGILEYIMNSYIHFGLKVFQDHLLKRYLCLLDKSNWF